MQRLATADDERPPVAWRAPIAAALEAIEGGDINLAVEILLDAREDGPLVGAGRYACPRCPATFPWPGARDDHEQFAHPEAMAA